MLKCCPLRVSVSLNYKVWVYFHKIKNVFPEKSCFKYSRSLVFQIRSPVLHPVVAQNIVFKLEKYQSHGVDNNIKSFTLSWKKVRNCSFKLNIKIFTSSL